jgi:hypothetical protein
MSARCIVERYIKYHLPEMQIQLAPPTSSQGKSAAIWLVEVIVYVNAAATIPLSSMTTTVSSTLAPWPALNSYDVGSTPWLQDLVSTKEVWVRKVLEGKERGEQQVNKSKRSKNAARGNSVDLNDIHIDRESVWERNKWKEGREGNGRWVMRSINNGGEVLEGNKRAVTYTGTSSKSAALSPRLAETAYASRGVFHQ